MRLVVAVRTRDEREVLPWFLTNCRFADAIYVADGRSQDGTWEWLQQAATQDSRLIVRQWPQSPPFYRWQAEHYLFLLTMVKKRPFDWLFLADADEIYSAVFQEGIREKLEALPAEPKTAFREPFYYLSPDCRCYYRGLSEWPAIAARNFIPWVRRENTETQFAVEPGDHFVDLPADLCAVHFNYLLPARFERKRRHYEAKFGYPAWHPEERFGQDKAPLPAEVAWWSPDGRLCHGEDMRGVFA